MGVAASLAMRGTLLIERCDDSSTGLRWKMGVLTARHIERTDRAPLAAPAARHSGQHTRETSTGDDASSRLFWKVKVTGATGARVAQADNLTSTRYLKRVVSAASLYLSLMDGPPLITEQHAAYR